MMEDSGKVRREIDRIERELEELREQLARSSKGNEKAESSTRGEAQGAEEGNGSQDESEGGPETQASGDEGKKEKMRLFVRRSDDGKKVIIDIGSMGEIVEEVVEGVKGEIQKSVLIDKGSIPIFGSGRTRKDVDEVSSSKIFSALGNEHRMRILKELQKGGMYASELEEKLPVAPSTLSNHLKILEDGGLIAQEAIRGRYLITILGRRSLRAARSLSSFARE